MHYGPTLILLHEQYADSKVFCQLSWPNKRSLVYNTQTHGQSLNFPKTSLDKDFLEILFEKKNSHFLAIRS